MPRPAPRFRDFIGQKSTVDLLRQQLRGAQDLREPFPHTLFIGPSGIGKTRLAAALVAEYGTRLRKVMGHVSIEDLAMELKLLEFGDFLFIDECQNLKLPCQELLFHVIDEGILMVPAGIAPPHHAPQRRPVEEKIPPSTIVLATDRPGSLLNALLKRVTVPVRLGYYNVREMREIVDRLATDMDLLITKQAAGLIARVSTGLPRRAKHHLENLRRHLRGAHQDQIGLEQLRRFLSDFGIDPQGLGEREREYLSYLAETGSASIESLSLFLGLDAGFVREQIESVLQRQRLISIGSKGRQLTAMGREYLNHQDANAIYEETNL